MPLLFTEAGIKVRVFMVSRGLFLWVYKYLWVLWVSMGVYESLWMLIGIYECLCMNVMGVYGYLSVPISIYGLLGVYGYECLWVSTSIYGYYGYLWVSRCPLEVSMDVYQYL